MTVSRVKRIAIPAILIVIIIALASVVVVDIQLFDPTTTVRTIVVEYFNDEVNGDKTVDGKIIGNLPGDGNLHNDYNFGSDRYAFYEDELIFLGQPAFGGLTNKEVFKLSYADFLKLCEEHPEEYATWKDAKIVINRADGKKSYYDDKSVTDVYGDLSYSKDYFDARTATADCLTIEEWAENDLKLRMAPVYGEEGVFLRGGDPALAAATLVDGYFNFNQANFLPSEIASMDRSKMADELHLKFLEDPDLWISLTDKYFAYLDANATFKVETLGSYTSAMYMRPNGLEENKPAVIVQDTSNGSGHALVITTKDGKQMLRFECGWQSVRTWYAKPNPPEIEITVTPPTNPPEIIITVDGKFSLTLTKVVNSGSSSKSFEFYYSFSNSVTLNGRSTTSGTVWLRDGESVTFSNIKSGTTYSITEYVPSGWYSNKTNDKVTGTINKSSADSKNVVWVTFRNTQRDEEDGKDPSKDPVNQGNAPVGGGENDDPGPGPYQPVQPDKPSTLKYSHYSADTSSITVDYGTAAGSVPLPSRATYYATDGTTGRGTLNVTSWGGYDGGTPGTYTVTLQILNTNGVAWAPSTVDGIRVSVTVRSAPQPAPETTPPASSSAPPNQDGATPPPTDPIPVVTDSHDVDDDNGDGRVDGNDSSAGNENGSFTPPD